MNVASGPGRRTGAVWSHRIATVRETVCRRSLPLATRHLQIVTSTLGLDAGLMGAAQLASDAVFAPARVDAVVEQFR